MYVFLKDLAPWEGSECRNATKLALRKDHKRKHKELAASPFEKAVFSVEVRPDLL